MEKETYEDIVAHYGEPLLRFKPEGDFKGFTEQQKREDVPEEIMVVSIKGQHISEVMVYARYGWGWAVNAGERYAIRHLLQITKDVPLVQNNVNGDNVISL